MNERSSRGPGRRVGREPVLEAAMGLLESADLADLLLLLGTRAVADAADVQPSTVHHHFATRRDGAKPNARLAAAVIEACHQTEVAEQTVEEADSLAETEPDPTQLAEMRILAEADLQRYLEHRRLAIGTFAAAVVARNDPVAADILRHHYESTVEQYGSIYAWVAESLGRRFDVEHGFTPETFATLTSALVDGLVLRYQFDPDQVRPELFGEVVFRLFDTATVPIDVAADDDAVVERLLRGRGSLDLPAGSQLDPGKRARIVGAARSLFETGGVDALTVTAVAQEAGVGRSTVISHFGGVAGLAGAVWAQYVPPLEQRLEADRARGLPVERTVERHLARLVELCRSTPELTSALLEGMFVETIRRGAAPGTRPDDPRTVVPLAELLVPVLLDARDELRPGVAGTRDEAADFTTTMTYVTMARAITRIHEPTSAAVQHLMDLFFDGILDPSVRGRG